MALSAGADVMIVTRDHVAHSALKAFQSGSNVVYVTTSGEHILPLDSVDAIIPRVERGKTYDPTYIQKVLDKIRSSRTRHGSLKRQFNEVEQEWSVLQKPVANLDGDIALLKQGFENGDVSTVAYKQTVMSLSMLQYKDVRGTYREKIDGVLAELRQKYVDTNMQRITQRGSAPFISVTEFKSIENLGLEVAEAANAGEKDSLTNAVASIRARTCEANARKARETFDGASRTPAASRASLALLDLVKRDVATTPALSASLAEVRAGIVKDTWEANSGKVMADFEAAGKTLDAYLSAMSILLPLRAEFAGSDTLRASADTFFASLGQAANAANPDYTFDYKGFPFTAEDASLFSTNQEASSIVTVASIPVVEQCLLIPKTPVAPITRNASFSQEIRLIFNQSQAADRTYSLQMFMLGRGMTPKMEKVLPPLPLQNGHLDLRLSGDLAFLPSDFQPVPDPDGRIYLYVFLAARDTAPTEDMTFPWKAISQACRWPVEF